MGAPYGAGSGAWSSSPSGTARFFLFSAKLPYTCRGLLFLHCRKDRGNPPNVSRLPSRTPPPLPFRGRPGSPPKPHAGARTSRREMENGKTGRSSSGLSVTISLKSGDRDFGRLSSGLSVPSLFHALDITFAEHLHSFIFVQILQIPVRHLAVSHLHDIDINGLFPPLFVNVFHGFKI